MTPEMFARVEHACCYVTVMLGEEVISEGTGFSYTEAGEVLTAAHVVTGTWPVRHDDYKDPDQRIYCKFPNLLVAEYRVLFCSIELHVAAFTSPVQVDLAVLLPKAPFPQPVPFIPARAVGPKVGERVFMAGYSEEIELPFEMDRRLERDYPGAAEFRAAMRLGYMADMTGPLFKSGIVGNVRRIFAENYTQGDRVECDVMYIDNSMHPGASGARSLMNTGRQLEWFPNGR